LLKDLTGIKNIIQAPLSKRQVYMGGTAGYLLELNIKEANVGPYYGRKRPTFS
jgi:hypothetical protein